jgi:DNA gyrase subunit A
MVDAEDDILIITDDGTIIRMHVSAIRILSRGAGGVILMRTQSGSKVMTLARTFAENEEEYQLAALPEQVADPDDDVSDDVTDDVLDDEELPDDDIPEDVSDDEEDEPEDEPTV